MSLSHCEWGWMENNGCADEIAWGASLHDALMMQRKQRQKPTHTLTHTHSHTSTLISLHLHSAITTPGVRNHFTVIFFKVIQNDLMTHSVSFSPKLFRKLL